MTAPTARLEALEAEAFRTQSVLARVVDRIDHLTSAVGDLSQDARATALDIREIRAEMREMRGEMQQGFAAVLARLDALQPER